MPGSTRIGKEGIMVLTEELGLESYLLYLTGLLDHADARVYGKQSRLFLTADIAARTELTTTASARSMW